MAVIDKNNIDKNIRKAIDKYFEKGLIADGMFWNMAIGLLEEKYHFKLKVKAK